MHPSVSRRLGIRFSAALLSVLLLAGCADALVDVDDAASDAVAEPAPLPLRLDAGGDPYVCVLSQRLADGTYATARYVPTFTEAAIAAAGGQTTTFTYRLRARDGTVRRHAACTVPASTPALAAIAAQLQRPTDGGDWHKADTGGARTHQDEAEMVCYDRDGDGFYDDCELGEIEVEEDRDWPGGSPPWPGGGGGGGDGDSDGGGGGGGGGSGGSVVTPWDVADWVALGISLSDFIRDPSLANFGWLLLDVAGSLLPVVPTAGIFRHGSDLLGSANDALKAKSIFVSTPNGSVVPIPKGFQGWRADNGRGIVYQKPGSTGNANSVRIVDPGVDPRYPEGYVRFYNEYGQPLDKRGKPGSQSATHHHLGDDLDLPGFYDFFTRHNR